MARRKRRRGFGELRRSKTKWSAAAIRDARRNFTAAVSGVSGGAPARKIRVGVEVRRAHGTARRLGVRHVKAGLYVAKACLGHKKCEYAKGATPTKAVKLALAVLSASIKTR